MKDYSFWEYAAQKVSIEAKNPLLSLIVKDGTREELFKEWEQYQQKRQLWQAEGKKNLIHLTNPTNLTTLTNLTKHEERELKKEIEKRRVLSGKRPIFKQLKGGIHKNTYYFGTVIFDDDRSMNAVVSSEGEIYIDWDKDRNEISDDYELFYRGEFYFDALDSHISYEGIRRFLAGEEVSLKSCYDRLLQINEQYMYYPDNITHKIIVIDIMSTYFLPLFAAKGRKLMHAEQGSGKTRQGDIYTGLACNCVKSPDTSGSSFFRLMESTVWTLVIDDFDSIGEEQRTAILQHYKTGYKPGSKSLRTGESVRGKRPIESFNNYGHVIINNTTGLDDISKDRTLPLRIVKSNRKFPDLPPRTQWHGLVDDLFICALNNWSLVKSAYEDVEVPFRGRQAEISKDLIAIAGLIDETLQEEVLEYVGQTMEQSALRDFSGDWLFIALQEFIGKEAGYEISLSVLAQRVFAQDTSAGSAHRVSIWLGKKFDMLGGIFSKKRPQNAVHIVLKQPDALNEYLSTKGWLGALGMLGQNGVIDTEKLSLVDFVQGADNGDGVKSQSVAKEYGDRALDSAIELGHIFEVKPGMVKVIH